MLHLIHVCNPTFQKTLINNTDFFIVLTDIKIAYRTVTPFCYLLWNIRPFSNFLYMGWSNITFKVGFPFTVYGSKSLVYVCRTLLLEWKILQFIIFLLNCVIYKFLFSFSLFSLLSLYVTYLLFIVRYLFSLTPVCEEYLTFKYLFICIYIHEHTKFINTTHSCTNVK